MPQSLSQVILHVIFSTKSRAPFIDEQIIKEMHAYLATTSRDQGWECYRVGGVEDHVHLLVRQPRIAKLSDFIGHIKRNATKWMHTKGDSYKDFAWQDGYGAFSIGCSQMESVIDYIDRQKEHHEKLTFQEEYKLVLQKYNIEYEEKYVWD
jgi:putative transposase|tara:strand:+ start:347 stop:799 length:453 start_codon:yes stop_codon:yes gene_type:complete